MNEPLAKRFQRHLPTRDTSDPDYVPELVDAILAGAREASASDVHLQPTADSMRMTWRIDGVLQPVAEFPKPLSPRIVARLKVLADLLTYQTEMPQEGRLRDGSEQIETRISTFPTMYGEKAVVRLFVGSGKYRYLGELGLSDGIVDRLKELLGATGGVILLTGPAGSGKTTTIYASLREIVNKSAGQRSLVSLEDPIEVAVNGVAQSQVNRNAGFDMWTGLRSLLRQDPEVIMVGEIRDRATAETVFQASMTGHLVLTTFHAGSAAQAIGRLADMGIEPYLLRSGLQAVLCQRLLRRLCRCAKSGTDEFAKLGLPVEEYQLATGCQECGGTGYKGRTVICEMLLPELGDIGEAILARRDSRFIERAAKSAGMVDHWQQAVQLVNDGLTSPEEVQRVLGWSTAE